MRRSVKTLVRKLLLEHRVTSPPVPVEEIARLLGAHVTYAPFEGDLSGMVYREKSRVVIGVNSLHHSNRQRFTIAHEIGHMLLHPGKEIHIDRTFYVNLRDDLSTKAVDPQEIQANQFAAELLMPENLLLADLAGRVIDFESDESLRKLALRYRVSPQALTLRLTNLGFVVTE